MEAFFISIMSNHYVYILYSKNLDRYFIGSARNVEERFKKHLQNHKGFTSKAKDWEIRYKEIFNSKEAALARKSRKMIESLIDSNKD